MAVEIAELKITVTKTSDGLSEYVQIMSSDMMTINVVMIAGRIEIEDARSGGEENL